MTCRTTHHAGCACHEARHAEEIARLRARVETAERERDIALADDAMHFAALRHLDDVHAKVRGERDALRDAAREMLAAVEAPAPVWDADESEHDTHAARLTAAIAALRPLVGDGAAMQRDSAPVRFEPMSDGALDAACAAEDHATADDPLLDGTDGAHPAWWRGHDRAAEMLTAQRDAAVARAEAAGGERDALRDAAREYLDAEARQLTHSDLATWRASNAARTRLAALVGDGETMRRNLPAESVVSCPACGYGCTADLIDGAYVLRPHSRRETARVGLGGIVWCDGGTVRAR